MFKVTEPTPKRRKVSNENDTYLWCLRLGHINVDMIERLPKDGPLRELRGGTLSVCESCLEGKKTKSLFLANSERAKAPFEIIHTNLCGPLNLKVRGGYENFVTFIDDYSRFRYAYLMKIKYETFEKFREFFAKAGKQLDKSIKTLRSDQGGEYLDYEFNDHLIENGIISQLLCELVMWHNVSQVAA